MYLSTHTPSISDQTALDRWGDGWSWVIVLGGGFGGFGYSYFLSELWFLLRGGWEVDNDEEKRKIKRRQLGRYMILKVTKSRFEDFTSAHRTWLEDLSANFVFCRIGERSNHPKTLIHGDSKQGETTPDSRADHHGCLRWQNWRWWCRYRPGRLSGCNRTTCIPTPMGTHTLTFEVNADNCVFSNTTAPDSSISIRCLPDRSYP